MTSKDIVHKNKHLSPVIPGLWAYLKPNRTIATLQLQRQRDLHQKKSWSFSCKNCITLHQVHSWCFWCACNFFVPMVGLCCTSHRQTSVVRMMQLFGQPSNHFGHVLSVGLYPTAAWGLLLLSWPTLKHNSFPYTLYRVCPGIQQRPICGERSLQYAYDKQHYAEVQNAVSILDYLSGVFQRIVTWEKAERRPSGNGFGPFLVPRHKHNELPHASSKSFAGTWPHLASCRVDVISIVIVFVIIGVVNSGLDYCCGLKLISSTYSVVQSPPETIFHDLEGVSLPCLALLFPFSDAQKIG